MQSKKRSSASNVSEIGILATEAPDITETTTKSIGREVIVRRSETLRISAGVSRGRKRNPSGWILRLGTMGRSSRRILPKNSNVGKQL